MRILNQPCMKTTSLITTLAGRLRTSLLLGCITLLSYSTYAQSTTWRGDLGAVPADGFYKIPLSPQILSKAGNKFDRIRIFESVNEVPFLVQKGGLESRRTNLELLPIIAKETSDSLGYLTFINENVVKLSTLNLQIERAWATKRLKISGSNDQTNWFVVRSEFLLNTSENSANANETTVNYTVELPLTNYKYYKLEANNKENLALNIRSIGYFSQSVAREESFAQLPDPVIETLTTNHSETSLFKLTFPESYLIDRLVFEISAPRFFHREARLYRNNPLEITKKTEPMELSNLLLSSKNAVNKVDFDNYSTRTVFLWVENQNNPPLALKSVHGLQHYYYLNAYLEKGKKYQFQIGADSLPTPVYDLANFSSQIGEDTPIATIGTLQKAEIAPETTAAEPFFKSKLWIWLGLSFVAGLLVYMSIRMIRELSEAKNRGNLR
jgi:hypothetical protein